MDRLREIVDYINTNQVGFVAKLKNFKTIKIKILLIKCKGAKRLWGRFKGII